MYSLPTVSHQILHITEVDWSCSTIIQINEELRSKKKKSSNCPRLQSEQMAKRGRELRTVFNYKIKIGCESQTVLLMSFHEAQNAVLVSLTDICQALRPVIP